MPASPLRYFDRYTRTVKTELIYGEGWLRLAYENPPGRLLVWLLFRRKVFSLYFGLKMKTKASALKDLASHSADTALHAVKDAAHTAKPDQVAATGNGHRSGNRPV